MSIRVWIFNHYAVAPGTSGGTRHFDFAKELTKTYGHQVTIFASSFDHQTRQEKRIKDGKKTLEETYDGVKFVWIKTTPYRKNDWRRVLNMLSYTFRSYFNGKKQPEAPDVIIGSLMHPFAALLGFLLARKKGCKFYFEERDLWPQSLIDLGKVSEKNPVVWILAKLEKFLYRKADRIIVLFDKAVQYVEQKGIASEKVVYLPNGVDLIRHDQSRKELPAEMESFFESHADKFIAMYTGTHGMANYLDALLDSAKLLQSRHNTDVHFLLVGDGPEKVRLQKRKDEERIDNVTFMSPVVKEMVPALLERASVGLLPLQDSPVFKWGISPNKLFDYMAASLPVILLCNLEGSPVEYADGGAVIKDNFSINLANKLEEFAADPAQAALKGLNGRRYVEKHHSWDRLSGQMAEILEQDIYRKEKQYIYVNG